ncbi:hypothetical protein [Cohnella abietis]|uniref:Uncharacterized protein n=1 Tax=Cohnella abietis TaxID=2507935 RepID=A0A3T1DFI1_9BACL|nr:hypothetical protein [Cohnella abietis]BBI36738.1 hypothetical protein KCTCHS21_61370 [Cohnella abietis]
MQRYIDEIVRTSVKPQSNSSILFNPRFMEWNDCILLDMGEKNDLPQEFVADSIIHDRTGFEASENHLHINDFISTNEPYQLLHVGLDVMRIWGTELKREYPDAPFHLILSFDGDECVVRFHVYRIAEGAWINLDSLDKYNEGLMLEEI